jgi:hypothetical protein
MIIFLPAGVIRMRFEQGENLGLIFRRELAVGLGGDGHVAGAAPGHGEIRGQERGDAHEAGG